MSDKILIIVIIASMVITFSLRALPFVLFGRKREAPELIKKLGELLPYAVISSLVVYCLKDIPTIMGSESIKLIVAVVCTVFVHIYKRNTILSISIGTVLYMILVHL